MHPLPSPHLSPAEPQLAAHFGARVRQLRTARRISQAALARTLGVDKRTVSRIEHGRTFPGDRVQAIAEALSVEPLELFRFGSERQRNGAELAALVGQIEADPALAALAVRILRALAGK